MFRCRFFLCVCALFLFISFCTECLFLLLPSTAKKNTQTIRTILKDKYHHHCTQYVISTWKTLIWRGLAIQNTTYKSNNKICNHVDHVHVIYFLEFEQEQQKNRHNYVISWRYDLSVTIFLRYKYIRFAQLRCKNPVDLIGTRITIKMKNTNNRKPIIIDHYGIFYKYRRKTNLSLSLSFCVLFFISFKSYSVMLVFFEYFNRQNEK